MFIGGMVTIPRKSWGGLRYPLAFTPRIYRSIIHDELDRKIHLCNYNDLVYIYTYIIYILNDMKLVYHGMDIYILYRYIRTIIYQFHII